jgi:hypothetical protein
MIFCWPDNSEKKNMKNQGVVVAALPALLVSGIFCLSPMASATEQEAAKAPAPATDSPSAAAPATESSAPATSASPTPAASPAPAAPATGSEKARDALKQKSDDATSEKNLEQVFQASEKTYSLLKKGNVSFQYGVDYSFYRADRIDLATATDSSTITRFRIENDAQHALTISLEASYGVWNNLTFTASLPLVYKADTNRGLSTTALGDMSLGLRWQPIPLKRGLPTTTMFAGLSTATGDSPYEINQNQDLATGKGYYSLSAGISANKVADPIVLFGSASYGVNSRISDLNQPSGSRILTGVAPGDSIGMAAGMAYALNYDVSLTASYQQSYAFASTYYFLENGAHVHSKTADQMSASLNFSVGLRTNPKRIVNISFGYGLTEDTPDVMVGFSMPLDFISSVDE